MRIIIPAGKAAPDGVVRTYDVYEDAFSLLYPNGKPYLLDVIDDTTDELKRNKLLDDMPDIPFHEQIDRWLNDGNRRDPSQAD